MTPPPRAARGSGQWAPAFPQPISSFAGRQAELARIVEHVDAEALFFVYGVGGIGKSVLVYQVIHELRARPGWSEATPILAEVRPGATATRTLAQVLAAIGAAPVPRRGQPTEQAHLAEQLAVLARVLDERPFLLFLDDVHHLPAEPLAEALRYLARHVRRSRLFVASRREIVLPADAPAAVVTTLGPLDAAAAEQMMRALAERMQIPWTDRERMLRATHGSPFHIRQMLARLPSDGDALDESLRVLSPASRRVLLAAAVAESRPPVEALRRAWPPGPPFHDTLRELVAHFLVDVEQDRLSVHDLIREALVRGAAPAEIVAAHLDAAALCLDQLRHGGVAALIHAVDAVNHYLAAGHFDEAWAVVEQWHSALAAAGSDHLLREPLERLRLALPARRTAVELLIARCLVRASSIEEADRVLAQIAEARTEAEAARHDILAGEVAQRRGDLVRAEALFARAAQRAPDEGVGFLARVQLASVAAFAGDGDRARRVLDEALAGLREPTARQRARCQLTRITSWMIDERFEVAAEEARRARLALTEPGLDDLASRLAMLETLARLECDDMRGARAAASAIDEAGLRRPVASLYRAIAAYADGEAQDASVTLVALHDHLRDHGDTLNAYLAGYYGAAALAVIGKLGQGRALAERTAQLAHAVGLRRPAAQAMAQQALLAADGVQSGLAHRLASEALANEQIGPRSRALAHCAHARACTIEGDIARALEHLELARAAVAAPELAAAVPAIDIEQGAVELVGGNLQRAVEFAERAADYFREHARDYPTAHAQLVLAAAYIARGRRTDILFAERTVAQAQELAGRGALRSIQVGCAILVAALARREHRERAAGEVLAEALRQLDPERGTIYASALVAAIEGGPAARALPGAVALLAHLGFRDAVDCYLVDRSGRRAATESDIAREQQLRELFVDEAREVILAQRGQVEIRGRPMQSALLAVLIQARGEPVAPAVLYKRVWGGAEYHPLRHRNALYVGINRLRTSLREALPGRVVIERASDGWRLADAVDACAAIAVRDKSR